MSFRHSPSEHIQQIRNDLRDRYSSGFPILKELLQNADDAGAEIPGSGSEASQCVIVLCPNGLPEGKHALLKSAGLCLINDGDFTSGDANSINSYGLSNRGGQAGTAGKFGLGLKSIFHWAEAFFYFSSQTFKSDGEEQSHPFDLQNPWFNRYTKKGLHRDWDAKWMETSDPTGTQKADFNVFKRFAGAVVGETRWFGLWIPFRTEEQTKDVPPIEKRFPKPDFHDLFGEDWLERVVEALPLLRRIRTVRFGVWRDGGFVEECCATLAAPSSRMSFGTDAQVPPLFQTPTRQRDRESVREPRR